MYLRTKQQGISFWLTARIDLGDLKRSKKKRKYFICTYGILEGLMVTRCHYFGKFFCLGRIEQRLPDTDTSPPDRPRKDRRMKIRGTRCQVTRGSRRHRDHWILQQRKIITISKHRIGMHMYHSALRLILIRFQTPSIKTSQDSPVCFKDSKNRFHVILGNRAWKGLASQHCRSCPNLANRPALAVLAGTALPCPICQDFMQYLFGILEAYWLTL